MDREIAMVIRCLPLNGVSLAFGEAVTNIEDTFEGSQAKNMRLVPNESTDMRNGKDRALLGLDVYRLVCHEAHNTAPR